jgi:hypothetical protein
MRHDYCVSHIASRIPHSALITMAECSEFLTPSSGPGNCFRLVTKGGWSPRREPSVHNTTKQAVIRTHIDTFWLISQLASSSGFLIQSGE